MFISRYIYARLYEYPNVLYPVLQYAKLYNDLVNPFPALSPLKNINQFIFWYANLKLKSSSVKPERCRTYIHSNSFIIFSRYLFCLDLLFIWMYSNVFFYRCSLWKYIYFVDNLWLILLLSFHHIENKF